MNATDEDEFGELLGLPSNVGTTNLTHAPTNPQNSSSLPEPDDLYNELYGSSSNPQTNASFARTGIQYNAFFGNVEKQNSLNSSISIPSQRGSELAHEPLFPDVDEAKIQPTVGLGGTLQQRPVTTETEFSIVVDPSGLDSRFASQSSGPMAGWVIPNQHSRRESHPQRPVQSTNFQSSTPGIRPPTGTNVGPLHPRSAPPTTNNSRASRIPAHCNADLEPEFPSRAAPDQALKLPGQTRVTPDEYKEFLGLGHGEIFNLDLDRVVEPPWRLPGAESSDFFNYGMDEAGWKEYCKKIEFHRQEFSMKKKIQTYESTSLSFQQDPDLPPEVAAAIAAETGPRTGASNEVIKALPIPVFQGLDDYSMRNRRGRDFRRPEVRFDSEVILELVGGLETSNAVNADYGEDYVALFGPGENLQRVSDEQDNSQVIDEGSRMTVKKEEALSASGEETPGTKEDTSAMFGDEDYNPSPYEGVQPGELAMGMDPTTEGQTQQSWPVQKPPGSGLGSRGGPPRPDFNRNFDFYSPQPGLWRPPAGFQQGPRGWRPRGGVHVTNPEFWGPGRGPFRGRGGGGRHWSGHPAAYGRRGGRQGSLQRFEDYSIRPSGPWSRPEDPGKPIPLDSEHPKPGMEESKDRGGVWYKEQGEDKHYYDRSRRREDLEDRSYSTTRFRGRDYKQDYPRSDRNLASIGRDRPTRHEDYEDRYREKRRPLKGSDRRSSRSSKEKLRVREKEEKRSRRHESSSDSGSDRGTGHYRNRS